MYSIDLSCAAIKGHLQDPNKAIVEIRIHRLHVIQSDGFAQQLLVEGEREAAVYVVTMEYRHTHYAAHKVKIGQVFLKRKQIYNQ